MISKRQQLEQWTTVVADTGDLERIAALRPHDATTNPSLLLAAARDQRYRHLLDQAPVSYTHLTLPTILLV